MEISLPPSPSPRGSVRVLVHAFPRRVHGENTRHRRARFYATHSSWFPRADKRPARGKENTRIRGSQLISDGGSVNCEPIHRGAHRSVEGKASRGLVTHTHILSLFPSLSLSLSLSLSFSLFDTVLQRYTA